MAIPGTDSAGTGTTEETQTPDLTNDQPSTTTDAPAGEPEGDDSAYKTVESLSWEKIDPAKLPQSFNDRFVPKAVFTRNQQAIAEEKRRFDTERQAMLDLTRKIIAERDKPSGPTPTEIRKAELLELAAAGDKSALDEVVKMGVEERVQPMERDAAWRRAEFNARAADPSVNEHWDEIQQVLKDHPDIAQMAQMDNFRYADKVMTALGLERKTWDQAKVIEAQKTQMATLALKVAQYEKERNAGLPPSTTKAGTSAGRPAAGGFETVKDAGFAAWIESGGKAEDYR